MSTRNFDVSDNSTPFKMCRVPDMRAIVKQVLEDGCETKTFTKVQTNYRYRRVTAPPVPRRQREAEQALMAEVREKLAMNLTRKTMKDYVPETS